MNEAGTTGAPTGSGSVLRVAAFRRLWLGLGLSSLGESEAACDVREPALPL